jgi:hypothetical protein
LLVSLVSKIKRYSYKILISFAKFHNFYGYHLCDFSKFDSNSLYVMLR